ncbi:sigma factor-like helix-turn-helix DNA-binding protein [Staphylococcus capitis]|uniref:sigma factor-like helix-turn-helix DNA-binding protein n=1 Tax=Staphylococcus capitis TaxID=29388 RepID=UPI001B7D62FD|nr:sigma factor-like helix-turn-helix DNA-binding protein [Staphylococcus capitis]
MNYEDIHKLRDINNKTSLIIKKIINQLREELKLSKKDLYTLVIQNPELSIEDIIKINTPKSKFNIAIRYLSGSKYLNEISTNHQGFSNKEKAIITRYNLNNLNNLLSSSYSRLLSYSYVGKKNLISILKKLLQQVVVYNKHEIFMGDTSRLYFKFSRQKFLLNLKEVLLNDLIEKFNVIKEKELLDEKMSLTQELDLLVNNNIVTEKLMNLDVSKLAEDIAYIFIKQSEFLYDIDELTNKLSNEFKRIDWDITIKQLLEQDLIGKNKFGKIFSKKPSILLYAAENFDATKFEMIRLRLKGKTLEEIGKTLGVTRERVRQIVKKILDSTDEVFREDDNSYWFKTYNLDAKQYALFFRDDFYNYLSIRYKKGNHSWEDIIYDDKASVELKKSVRNELLKGKIELGNKVINRNRTGIIDYILEEFCQDAVHISDVLQLYNLFIEEQGLNNQEFNIDIRYLENRLSDTSSSVSQGKKIYRYYNYNQYDWDSFYKNINFEEWKDLEISSLIIFKQYPILMKSYDIRHANELHNIIKRTLSVVEDLRIDLSRMPNIKVGNVNREQQVKDLMFEYAPIHINNFVDLYYENYGIKKQTIKANYLQFIDNYISGEIINVSYDSLSKKDIDYVQRIIKDQDFIFIEDIKAELKYEIKEIQLILKYLGYKIFSSYILKNHYETSVSYFNKNFYDQKNILDFTNIDKRLWRLSTFTSWLFYKFKEMKIFEFFPKKFITIKKLDEIGLTYKVLNDFREEAIIKLSDHRVWSINTLIDLIDSEDIDQYGFEPLFYRSILRGVDNIYSNKMGGNYLLKLDEDFSLTSLIEEEIIGEKVIDIFDLTQIINDKYDVQFNYSKLIESIKHTNMYYDEIMEKVYLDLDYYYEEFEA